LKDFGAFYSALIFLVILISFVEQLLQAVHHELFYMNFSSLCLLNALARLSDSSSELMLLRPCSFCAKEPKNACYFIDNELFCA
jgi:hypothetical protein